MILAELAELLIPTPEYPGSNPFTANFMVYLLPTGVHYSEKRKIKSLKCLYHTYFQVF